MRTLVTPRRMGSLVCVETDACSTVSTLGQLALQRHKVHGSLWESLRQMIQMTWPGAPRGVCSIALTPDSFTWVLGKIIHMEIARYVLGLVFASSWTVQGTL
mmetsp:Transcript_100694/g.184048  ORF Transcript_100694/g.184048 Transcript_100694/m.184048 type:complete len:102 (-) Transcript_100694:523-828(-)